MFKRQPISFNLECPHQKALYDWCKSESANFSGFVKTILYFHMQSKDNNFSVPKEQSFVIKTESKSNELDLILGLI